MNIPIVDESEIVTADIETYVSAGVVRYKIQFLNEWQRELKDHRESVQYEGDSDDTY